MEIVDEYTGHVEPGGAAARRTLPELTITKVSVGPMDNNSYLLTCRKTGEAALIDAANDPQRLLELLGHEDDRPQLRTIITTHQHADHWQALGAVAGATGSNTIAHPLDSAALPVPPDTLVTHGDSIEIGEITLSVIHLRGHTPGSIALLYRDPEGHPHLFTGDSLFPGGVGKTNSPEDFKSLLDDVENRLFWELPDEAWFYPGHGDDSTIGEQREHIQEWRQRGW
ncbi:MBL fold metallo-hydrolase [Pseudonocardiaceae bacterium YIM PH 21723]|nr:MBL fold metallo-hydrolase [Pseudonocardiaceae bacterium YIM PH 21723]